jgi:hypothetical protein
MYKMQSNDRLLTFSDNFVFSCGTQNSFFEFYLRKEDGALKVNRKFQAPGKCFLKG